MRTSSRFALHTWQDVPSGRRRLQFRKYGKSAIQPQTQQMRRNRGSSRGGARHKGQYSCAMGVSAVVVSHIILWKKLLATGCVHKLLGGVCLGGSVFRGGGVGGVGQPALPGQLALPWAAGNRRCPSFLLHSDLPVLVKRKNGPQTQQVTMFYVVFFCCVTVCALLYWWNSNC